MPLFSGKDKPGTSKPGPVTGDGRNSSSLKPQAGEIVVRTKGGSALLKSTADLFKGKRG